MNMNLIQLKQKYLVTYDEHTKYQFCKIYQKKKTTTKFTPGKSRGRVVYRIIKKNWNVGSVLHVQYKKAKEPVWNRAKLNSCAALDEETIEEGGEAEEVVYYRVKFSVVEPEPELEPEPEP